MACCRALARLVLQNCRACRAVRTQPLTEQADQRLLPGPQGILHVQAWLLQWRLQHEAQHRHNRLCQRRLLQGLQSTTQGLTGWQRTHLCGDVETEVWIVVHLLVAQLDESGIAPLDERLGQDRLQGGVDLLKHILYGPNGT